MAAVTRAPLETNRNHARARDAASGKQRYRFISAEWPLKTSEFVSMLATGIVPTHPHVIARRFAPRCSLD